jgi:predicted nucleotidyltransferase
MSRCVSPIPESELAAFCRRHGVRRLSLFGSVLRSDFAPESDVDVLVEFEPGQTPGLLAMAGPCCFSGRSTCACPRN